MAPAGDVALACMLELVDELARRGLTDAAICPGSRSTPLALAFARHGGVRVHVHLDERSAAFFALGLGMATGRPAAVVTTSGTATANLLPAAIEAFHSPTPLLLLTADRPPEWRGTGANQTIHQPGLYGTYTRWSVDADVPEDGPEALAYWRSLAADAAGAALGPPAGAVHVNLPFREPLVPNTEILAPASRSEPATDAAGPSPSAHEEDVERLANLVASTERGVVVAGGLREDAAALADLAAAAGWPLIADPASGLRTPPHALAGVVHALGAPAFAETHVPEVVLLVGLSPVSRPVLSLIDRVPSVLVVDPDGLRPNVAGRLSSRPGVLAAAVLERITPRGDTDWVRRWRDASAAAARAADSVLDSFSVMSEARVARDVGSSLPDGSTLVCASSMPIRDLDANLAPREGLRVLANRGASGIDGFVSTVLGVAASGAPTWALAGDLSMLHDASGLLWNGRRSAAATFVVPDNDGGGVFDLLPQRDLPERDALFVTPHGLDLEDVARAAGAAYRRVEAPGDLTSALELPEQGITVVHVPIDRAAAVEQRRAVAEAVAAALG